MTTDDNKGRNRKDGSPGRLSVRSMAWALTAVLISSFWLASASAKKAKLKKPDGGQLFAQYCVSCHPGGGNAAKNRKPIYNSKVLVTFATFKKYLESPPGHMPHYQQLVKDDSLMRSLYNYCQTFKSRPSDRAFGGHKNATPSS
ncbi:MAG TPA: cytochrome c [Candidatus Obscuribacterales bacterium]